MSFIERLRGKAVDRLRKSSVIRMARLACWVALVGLAVMAASILDPAPLTVIFAMSIGQVIGIVAFLCYLLSVLMDVLRGTHHAPNAPGPAQNFREPNPPGDVTNST